MLMAHALISVLGCDRIDCSDATIVICSVDHRAALCSRRRIFRTHSIGPLVLSLVYEGELYLKK